MMKSSTITLTLAVGVLGSGTTANNNARSTSTEYVWPSKNDYIEDVYMLQSGFNKNGFVDPIINCGFGQNEAGRQNAAEWLRTAYHDMSTHDVDSGTGGLDASIMFETGRAENPGTAFAHTFGHLVNFYTTRSSAADLLALSVVGALSACNANEIPFRVGRVDATEAGPSGVPEPSQDLQTHTEKFKKQGFNQTEMIELVACGHTLGGIHGANFPQITKDNSTGQVSHFEYGKSNEKFDNVVVTEYLSGNTSNLLVAGTNDTLNSDKRIFGSDGNETMEALADATYYQTRCQDVITRMIDTVPKEVVLSDLKAIEIKPYINLLALNTNGTMDFTGYIRVRFGNGATHPDADDLSAFLSYKDRSGNNVTQTITAKRSTYQSGLAAGFKGYSFVFFEWTTQLDAAAGISAFNIHLTTKSTGVTEVYDNVGNNYPLSDTVLYQMKQSCSEYTKNATTGVYDGQLTIMAAVRSDAVAGKNLDLHFVKKVARPGLSLDRLDSQVVSFAATGKTLSGFDLYKVDQMYIDTESQSTTFDIVLGEDVEVDFVKSTALTSQKCAAL